jgi:hypothetical protein
MGQLMCHKSHQGTPDAYDRVIPRLLEVNFLNSAKALVVSSPGAAI